MKAIFPALILSCVFVFSAVALTVEQAKKQGLVGETLSGYLAVVDTNNATADKLVAQINHEREIKYSEIAKKNNLQTRDVGKIAGQKLVERADSGEYVRGINGQWLKKK
ncbi:YdbL family protein [Providencia vermicola]|uniref:YdbL family protein n=2 Tax=Providencia TaxID=586 RepID=A0AAI9HZ69_PROST|nr:MULTISPECIES: YdbL family protein [Providencia]ELR5045652.1 YdbL family protein [Providencia rettgeri]ELR5035491.1 YdbL family protein [Providencia stuartii]ELR5120025.1 YdbL family protein [Providencia stuartii]ELR5141781.1 YdbL family protein [Providencia stuartii]ELR5291132.1 YdbL family protein [Providencia stuartii]